MLMIVVGEDGFVRNAQVTRSLGAFLDSKAVEMVKNWKFEPATKNDKPVAGQFAAEIYFSSKLHRNRFAVFCPWLEIPILYHFNCLTSGGSTENSGDLVVS